MKPVLLSLVLLLTSCATGSDGELSGRHEKNGAPVLVERLGDMTTSPSPGELRCGSRKVMWCAGGRSQNSCECVLLTEAEARVRRIADQMRTARFSNP